jgi:hypothetical protein
MAYSKRDAIAGGWDIIESVEPQVWCDEYGNAELEVIWILTKDSIFARDLFKGETVDRVAEYYRNRRCTDSACDYYGKR